MTEIVLYGLAGINLVFALIIVRLVAVNRQIARTLSELEKNVDRNSKDIAGLCAAAVNVDSNFQQNSRFLAEVMEKLSELEQQEPGGYAASPYQNVIARIHQGATVEQLVNDCGISQEEAKLLIRLHGEATE